MENLLPQRIKSVLAYKGLTYSYLSELWGIKLDTVKGYFRRPKLGEQPPPKISANRLTLLAKDLDIDLNWLQKGEGFNPIDEKNTNKIKPTYVEEKLEEYRKTPRDKKQAEYKYSQKINLKPAPEADLIPYYDVQIMASPIEVFSDQTTTPTFKMDIPGFSDCDFAVNVYGHSMYPTFESGSIVICKRIIHKEMILYGECYFIVTDEYRMVKRLLKCAKPGWVTASSDNHNGHNSPDGKTYGSQDIALKDILYLYLVKGSIKRHQV